MISYNRKGLIYSLDKKSTLMYSHSQIPVVDQINNNEFRIYFATRNVKGQSNISFIEVDALNPEIIYYEHNDVILELGNPGTFDDSGIMPTCIVNVGIEKYLYYVGWSKCVDVPYSLALGLAISADGGKTFNKFSAGPIIGQSCYDPFFTGTASIMLDDGIFKMWFMSGNGWEKISGKMEPLYDIKYTESLNGINWAKFRISAIKLQSNEGGLAKPSVVKIKDMYHMWYSYRNKIGFRQSKNNSYKIGHAESFDGILWSRLDDVELGLLENWDSDMQAYPHIITHENKMYLFYNGNGFGASGLGYAFIS